MKSNCLLSGAGQILQKSLLWGAYLRTTKASVGSVTGDIGLAAKAHHAHVGDLVGVVNVHHGSFHDGCAQVQAVAGIVVQLTVQGLHLAVLVECDLKGQAKPEGGSVLYRQCCDDEGLDWGNRDRRTECAAVLRSASVRGMMARVMTANKMPQDCSAVCGSAVRGMMASRMTAHEMRCRNIVLLCFEAQL